MWTMRDEKRRILPVLAAWLALSVPGAAAPQASQIGEVTLFGEEEFKIQAATKTEIPISQAPGSVTVISAAQIKESGARTIPEILRLVAGVNVRWNPMVQTIDMRSFGQNPFTSRVLLLIDGVPYNSWNKGGFPQHPGFDFFVLQNIKRLEIVRGAGSALYGENAYWGVINIVTLSGEDLEGGKVVVSGGDLESQSLGAIFGKKTKNGSYLISGQSFNGQIPIRFWTDGGSEVEGTDFFFKGVYKDFELSYYRHDDDADGFDNPGFRPGSRFRSAETISQTVEILATKFQHEWASGLSFAADVSFAQRDGSRCAACHAAPQAPAFEGTIDHGHQLIGDFRLGKKWKNHDLLFGVEAREVDTGEHRDELLSPDATTSKVVYSYTKAAAYVQDQIATLDGRLRFTLGARYDGSNDLFESKVSPRIAAVFAPNDKLVVRGGWSTAFRFPNFSELYQASFFLTLDGGGFPIPIQTFKANPELTPEEIRTFDFGVEYRISPTVSTKVDFFYSEVKDFIVLSFIRGQGPSTTGFENHPDEAQIFGSEVEFRWRPSQRFTAFANWAWQENEADGNGVAGDGRPLEFVYAPANKVNVGAYMGPFKGFRATLEAQWRDEHLGPSAWNFADRTTPAVLEDYVYINARLSWDLPVHLGNSSEAVRFSVYGQNLLDEQPQESFLPIDMRVPGTTFFGSIELRY
jgi:outer membrane receptor for ferrienterochelin and colicins